VGDYRVLYVVDGAAQVVEVIAIRHRREAYR
jgi:mRNA-degrading endonuclease RelE of RelBE toxin-antitoxin system